MTSPEKKIVSHVSPGLTFTISLKIIAKKYFQLNYTGKFSVYSFQKEAWSCDIARIEDGRERCQYLSLHEFCVSFHLYSLLKLVLFFIKPKFNFFFFRGDV